MTNRSVARIARLAPLFVLCLVAAVFWPGLTGGFIFDDYGVLADNAAVHLTSWDWSAWKGLITWSMTNIQRPLAMLSYALNYVTGGSLWGFKATNLGIHLFNTGLVWALTRRLLQAAWAANAQDSTVPGRGWVAWAVALAWAAHPLQVSAVLYVVQRMELLGFTFVLLALLAYARGREKQMAGTRAWPWLVAAVALTGIGFLAKETAVLVPVYACLLEWTLLGFRIRQPAADVRWKTFYAVGAALVLVVFVFYALPRWTGAGAYASRSFDAWQRELSQLRILVMYLYWCLLPLPSHLTFYYDNYAISTGWLHPATTLASGLLLAALAVVAFRLRRHCPLFAFGIGWFFIAHALTSAPISLELVFEHRNYPALLGVILAVADLLHWASRRVDRRVLAAVAMVLVANFAFLTALRAATWGNNVQLSITLASDNPGSARAALDLARRYMNLAQRDPASPLFWVSVRELERASSLPQSSPLADEALLLVAADHPDRFPDTSTWWAHFIDKIAHRPLGPEAHMALHRLMQERVNGKDTIDARQLASAYAVAVSREPNRFALREELGELAGAVLRDPALASRQWERALELRKDTRNYALQLGGYLVDQNRANEARAVLTKARALEPRLEHDPALAALQARADRLQSPMANARPAQPTVSGG